MAKISVIEPHRLRDADAPEGIECGGRVQAALDGAQDPLHLFHLTLDTGEPLAIGPRDVDCVGYVRGGALDAGGVTLPPGSSFIVEHRAGLDARATADDTRVLLFTAARPDGQARDGGHVHLLPAGSVPRAEELPESKGVGGAMHADSGCPTCEVWLHENRFPPSEPLPPGEEVLGVHCHSEDEIIVVLTGQMRLGRKLVGPGTAIAIHADTMYAFTPGPEGLSFVNFRSGTPGDIRFANGMAMSETGYWREHLPRPEYLEPA